MYEDIYPTAMETAYSSSPNGKAIWSGGVNKENTADIIKKSKSPDFNHEFEKLIKKPDGGSLNPDIIHEMLRKVEKIFGKAPEDKSEQPAPSSSPIVRTPDGKYFSK
jgi:hypothetical protein